MLIKRRLFTISFTALLSVTTHAATITAASCAQSDLNAVINGPTHTAVSGDKIIVPTGSCTWSGNITINVAIDLECATAGGCTITDTNSNAEGGPNCSSGDLICMYLDGSNHATIGGFNFVTGSGVGSGDYIVVVGTGLVPLMHDMNFNLPNFVLAHAVQWLVQGGVIWNTTFASTDNLSGACGSQVGSDSGSIVVKSSLPWDTPSTMGTLDTTGTNNLYIEDSTFSYVGQIPDVDDNGRVVLRHDQYTNTSGGLTHGTSSTFGGRQVEIYDNTFSYTNTNRNVNRYFWFRAGTAVITGNSFQLQAGQCYGTKNTLTFTVENATDDSQHGCCTGWMCFHQPGSGASATAQIPALIGSGNPSQVPGDNYQISDPVYVWGNTGTGQGSTYYGTNDNAGQGSACSNGVTTTNFYVSGRDYFYDDSGSATSGAKPGWVRYAYPHPLRALVSGEALSAPTGLAAVVH